jgi:hypothetical protein
MFFPAEVFEAIGSDAVVRAWCDYETGNRAWRWWSVSLVQSLIDELSFDDAWHLCVSLAHAAAARAETAGTDPVSMVGLGPMTDLF